MTASITGLHLQNYGCIKDLKLEGLGGLHAFIGPNDSGKSTILRGIRTLCRGMARLGGAPNDGVPYDRRLEGKAELQLVGPDFSYVEVASSDDPFEPPKKRPLLEVHREQLVAKDRFAVPPMLVRFDPDALREPGELIPDGKRLAFLDDRGNGLAGVYDAIRNRGDEVFLEISNTIRELFPTVRFVGLRNATTSTKELQLELIDGTKVPASGLSEGLLLFLAFAALPYLGQPPVILVEEPENGLHPARIKDVVAVLREVAKTSQVFMATHSPLVVNELKPEEVFVTTRSIEYGTQVTRLDQTPNFEKRSSVYANGELWIAYADGDQESALLEAGE